MGLSQIFIPALILLVASSLVKITRFLHHRHTSLHSLPGPPSAHWFWGDMKQHLGTNFGDLHTKWIAEYGTTFKFHAMFNVSADCKCLSLRWTLMFSHFQTPELFTTDLKGIQYVLNHPNIYRKLETVRHNMSRIAGQGELL